MPTSSLRAQIVMRGWGKAGFSLLPTQRRAGTRMLALDGWHVCKVVSFCNADIFLRTCLTGVSLSFQAAYLFGLAPPPLPLLVASPSPTLRPLHIRIPRPSSPNVKKHQYRVAALSETRRGLFIKQHERRASSKAKSPTANHHQTGMLNPTVGGPTSPLDDAHYHHQHQYQHQGEDDNNSPVG